MNGAKKQLKEIVALSEIVKQWTTGMALTRRLLLDEEDAHELQALATEAGSNMDTIQGALSELQRLTPFSKKFVAR